MSDSSQGGIRQTFSFRTLRAFHNPGYRCLWLADFLSYMSRAMHVTLLLWWVLVLTNSPGRVALVVFFGSIPMLFLGIVAGVMADRMNRQRLMTAIFAANFVVALGMTLILYSGTVQFFYAYVVVFLIGMANPLHQTSGRSLIHDLLGNAGLTNGIALDTIAMHGSNMLGPALAGVLITLVDVKGGFLVVTVFYATAAVLMASLKVFQGRHSFHYRTMTVSSLLEGVRYVRGHRVILAVVLITAIINMLMFSYISMVPVIARDVLKVGPALIGVLMSAQGLGALIGSVIVASAGHISKPGRIFLGGSLLALLGLILFSFSSWYFVSFSLLILLGLGVAGFSTMQATIVILMAKQEIRGRVLGVVSLAIGAGPLGALWVAGVATAVTPSFALGLNASLGLVAVGLVGLLMPSLRRRVVSPEQSPS